MSGLGSIQCHTSTEIRVADCYASDLGFNPWSRYFKEKLILLNLSNLMKIMENPDCQEE